MLDLSPQQSESNANKNGRKGSGPLALYSVVESWPSDRWSEYVASPDHQPQEQHSSKLRKSGKCGPHAWVSRTKPERIAPPHGDQSVLTSKSGLSGIVYLATPLHYGSGGLDPGATSPPRHGRTRSLSERRVRANFRLGLGSGSTAPSGATRGLGRSRGLASR